MSNVLVEIGQTWRHKRDRYRKVTIRAFTSDRQSVFVDRNTSRRKQPISLLTLRRDYQLYLTNQPR